jgi:hypothetical protein
MSMAMLFIASRTRSESREMMLYKMNLLTDESATPVIGPLVFSDMITSRKGDKY